MTPQQIETVQKTWREVLPMAEAAADLFYERLFTLDSRLRHIFPEDLSVQKKKLMVMLGRIVTGLRESQGDVQGIEDLGRRHVGYGVRSEDYDTVGEALLWALEQGLGSAWTLEVKASWLAAYKMLSAVMLKAAHEVYED